jgi:hypothetical protein
MLHTHLVHGLLDAQFCELRYTSPATARDVNLLVRYARAGEDLVVLAQTTGGDRWWRTFIRPYPVHVLLRGAWRQGAAHMTVLGQPAWRTAAHAFAGRFPRIAVRPGDIFIVVTLTAAGHAGDGR